MSCNASSSGSRDSSIAKYNEEINAARSLLEGKKNFKGNELTEEKRKEILAELTYFTNNKAALVKEKAECDKKKNKGGRRKTRKNKKSKRKTKSRR